MAGVEYIFNTMFDVTIYAGTHHHNVDVITRVAPPAPAAAAASASVDIPLGAAASTVMLICLSKELCIISRLSISRTLAQCRHTVRPSVYSYTVHRATLTLTCDLFS